MNCQECEQILSDYLDGDVEPECVREIEHHLGLCSRCAALQAELRQLIAASYALVPQISGPSVSTRKVHSLPTHPNRERQAPGVWARWKNVLFSRYVEIRLTVPQFAAALGLVGIFAMLGGWSYLHSPQPTPSLATRTSLTTVSNQVFPSLQPIQLAAVNADGPRAERAVLLDSIARLSTSLEGRKMNWNPQLRRVFERNMAIIDQSLEECEAALHTNPGDLEAEDMMLAAYREKLRLLQEFAAI